MDKVKAPVVSPYGNDENIKEEMCIRIWWSEMNQGYMYEVYNTDEVGEDTEPLDGGQMDSDNIEGALDMAVEVAKNHIEK